MRYAIMCTTDKTREEFKLKIQVELLSFTSGKPSYLGNPSKKFLLKIDGIYHGGYSAPNAGWVYELPREWQGDVFVDAEVTFCKKGVKIHHFEEDNLTELLRGY